jgi:hypothetical protein
MSASDEIASSIGENVSDMKGVSLVGKIVGLLVMVWLISISYYAFAFFALGMLPSVFAMILDRGKGRFASQTIASCNFIGILPFLFDIGMNYEKSIAAREVMMEPFTWATIYGFAIIGVMLIFVLPNIMSISFTLKAEYKLKKLMAEQADLIEEWGDEVRGDK